MYKVAFFAVIVLLVVSSLPLTIDSEAVPVEEGQEVREIHTPGGLTLLVRDATADDIELMKQSFGVGPTPVPVIDGEGTGFQAPNERGWDSLIGNHDMIVSVTSNQPTALNTSKDNSASEFFPPIGNQGSEGSCTTWAYAWYIMGFQQARENDWNLTGCGWTNGHPTPSYYNRTMTPDFLYHQINAGYDSGSNFYDAADVCTKIGISTWQYMPYSSSDHTTWPPEAAWRDAPMNRAGDSFGSMDVSTATGITNLKTWLDAGNLGAIAIDAYKYSSFVTCNSDQLWLTTTNIVQSRNHANTVVGYDDNFGPYTEENTTRYGAFKIANSWGQSWGGGDGCYWISYEAMKNRVAYVDWMADRIDYEPELLAVFNMSHAKREECDITFGIGSTSSPSAAKSFNNRWYRGGNLPFPSNDMCFDVTELGNSGANIYQEEFFLDVYDGDSTTTGSITKFELEMYDGYSSNNMIINATSEDPVVSTVQNNDVYAFLTLADKKAPTLVKDSTPSVGYTGDPFTFKVRFYDMGGMDSVFVEYWNGSGPVTNRSLGNGTDGLYSFTFTAPDTLDDVNYRFIANDSSGNWFHGPDSSFKMRDNDLPVLSVIISPTTMQVSGQEMFSVAVSDNIGVGTVTLRHRCSPGPSDILELTEGPSGVWSGSLRIRDTLGQMEYWFEARDTYGTLNRTAPTIATVIDTDLPTIATITCPDFVYPGEEIPVEASVADNIGLDQVRIVFGGIGDGMENATMTGSGGDRSYDIHGYDEVGTVDLHLEICDTSGNWVHSQMYFVDVLDNVAPSVRITAPAPSSLVRGTVDVLVNASDRHSSIASLIVTAADAEVYNSTVGAVPWDTGAGSDGNVRLTVTVADEAGNEAFDSVSVIVDNTAPTVGTGDDITVLTGTNVSLDGTGCSDINGIASLVWTFTHKGSEVTLTGVHPSYVFDTAGSYEITLTVTDNAGNVGMNSLLVSVDAPEPPVVVSTTPDDRAADVGVDTTISIGFDRAMAGTTTASRLSIDPDVELTTSWSDGGRLLEIVPDEELEPGTEYTLTLAGATSLEGAGLADAPFSFSFTTAGPVIIPELAISSPADGVGLSPSGTLTVTGSSVALGLQIVTISLGDQEVDTTINGDGTWMAVIPAPEDAGEYELSAECQGITVTRNVVVVEASSNGTDGKESPGESGKVAGAQAVLIALVVGLLVLLLISAVVVTLMVLRRAGGRSDVEELPGERTREEGPTEKGNDGPESPELEVLEAGLNADPDAEGDDLFEP